MASSPFLRSMASSPFLMLPYDETHTSLYSLEEKKPCTFLQYIPDFKSCVGSSHGWLAFLDKHANPLLVYPFSGTRISLPPSNTLPTCDDFLSSSSKIQKVAVSTDPSSTNYAVVVLFGFPSHTKMAFCRGGDERWSTLDRDGKTYYDIVVCEETNTAFAVGPGLSVASWDLNQTLPEKKMIIQDSCPRLLASNKFPTDLYSSQWYLASSLGKIYLVVRYIGHFVRYDGKVVYEGDTLTDDAAEPLLCPYRTVDFHVFKLDGSNGKKWIRVKTLNNFALFLGGNQSTMLSTVGRPKLERNAIYFTDDYWERMDEDYAYGGHDMGIFKLQDGTIHQILDCEDQKIAPPPFWIIKSS